MLDIGGSELLVIALVLILVVGPKDLPRLLRTAGRFMAKMRGMTREFQRSIDDMAREADIADMRKELNSVSDTVSGSISESDVTKKVEESLDSTGILRDAMKEDYGLTDEGADKAAAKLPPLAPGPDTETPEDEGGSAEAGPSEVASGDDANAESAPAVTEPAPAAPDAVAAAPEEKHARAGGAAEA